MSDAESNSEIVAGLAEEFVERYRRGERPPIREYVEKYPELADEIREVFPAVAMVENLAPAQDASVVMAGDSEPAPLAEPALKQLGDYRVLREVGRGGMGIVYEAEQLSLGRRVALKVLPQQLLLDKKHNRRFEREAKAAARLHHTNIVPVFGVGEQDGLHYYVMQFIQGLGLDEVIDELRRLKESRKTAQPGSDSDGSARRVARSLLTGQFERTVITGEDSDADEPDVTATAAASRLEVHQSGDGALELSMTAAGLSESSSASSLSDSFDLSGAIPLSGQSDSSSSTSRARRKQTFWTSVAHIGQQVASALQYAHEQGITHRDIKPSNLLLDMRGTVWVTDFGLAKASDQQDITHTGDILGTLRYMPPEAFEGQSGPSGDLYALGLTLYELLAQQPAFEERDRHKLIKLVTTTEPTRIDRLNRDVPRDLATIVHKAIDRDPSHRYASAREFADDLQRFLDDEPIRARRISTTERIARWSRRNKGLAGSLAAVCALLLVINIAGPVMTWRLQEEKEKLLSSESSLREANTDLRARERELEETGRQLEAETRRANTEAADARSEAAERERMRVEAERQRLLARRALYSSALFAAQHAFSTPEGYARAQELLDEVRPQAGDTEEEDLRGWEWYYLHAQLLPDDLLVQDFSQNPLSVAFSPHGQLFATSDGSGEVKLFDANSGRLLQTFVGHRGRVSWVAWNLDGTRLASSGEDQTARIWNVESGREELQLLGHTAWVAVVAWSPDGKQLVTGALDGAVRTWDATSGDNLLTIEGSSPIRGVDWSPDGQRLASGDDTQAVRIWDSETGESVQAIAGHDGRIARVKFSPDGQRIASVSWESAATAVIIWDAELGTILSKLSYRAGGAHDVKWSPDGSKLATAGFDNETVDIWNPDTGERLRSFSGHRARVLGCSWSPDGDHLASVGEDGAVRVWDAASEQPVIGDAFPVHCLAWNSDGSRIAAASLEHGVKIWDARTRQELLTFSGDRKRIDAVDWDPDGVRLASCGAGQVFHVWDAETGSVLHTINAARNGNIRRVVWSPDGTQVASAADDGTVRIFDAETGDEVQRFGLSTPYGLDWSHDGERLAAAAYSGDVMVWNVETGVELEHLVKPEQAFFEVRFSRDGRLAIAGARKPQQSIFDDSGAGTEGTVIVWDLETGTEQHRLRGHTAMVHSLDWSDDGARLLSAGNDGRLMLWDAATGAQLLVIRDSENQPTISAQFSPDELQIAAGGRAPGIRFWDATAGYAAELSDRLLPSLSEQIAANSTFDDLKLRGEILAALRHWGDAAEDFDRAAALATQGTSEHRDRWFTSPWWVIGPYREPIDTKQLPESNLDRLAPAAVPRANDSVEEPLKWMATVLGEDQGLNLGRFFHQAEQISGYAQLRIYSPVEQRVAALFGADDSVRLWLKSDADEGLRLLHSREDPRSAIRDDEAVDVTLHRGWHILLAEVINSTGDHGLFLRLSDDPVAIARVFARNEKWDEALAWWNRAYAERPDDPEVLVGRGRAALGTGQMDVAKQSFDAALADNESSAVRGVASAYADHARSLTDAGRSSEAVDSLQQARMLYEALLSGDEASDQDAGALADVLLADTTGWTVLEPVKMTSAGGATLTLLNDGSILASGENSRGDLYTIRAAVGLPEIRSVRLEALPDPSLPKQGPGRHSSGNFQLAAFRVFAAFDDDGGPADQLPIADVRASFAYQASNADVQGTIDDDDRRFWHVWGRTGERHVAVFELAAPLVVRPGQALIVQCAHTDRHEGINLGRFRLSVTSDPAILQQKSPHRALVGIADPWMKLGAAYALSGDARRATQSFARALDHETDLSERLRLVNNIVVEFGTDPAELVQLRPDDPPLLMALARQQADAGEGDAAHETTARARSLTEVLLAESPDDEALVSFLADLLLADSTRWTVLEPIETSSEGGATLTKQDDNSVLAGGPNPDHDVYTVTTAAADLQKIAAIRLEALTDDSLPGHGPGRFLPTPGEFVLNRFRVTTTSRQDQDSPVEVVLNAAAADYFYPPLPIAPDGPWHIGPGGAGSPHVAVYRLAEQVQSAEASPLTFEMTFYNGGEIGLQLGRFRLSVTDDPAAFELHDRQFTLSRIEDPWVRLGAAYTALGNSIQAAEWFARALERAPGFAIRRELVEQIDQLQADLSDLIALCPDDPLLLNILAQRQWVAGQMDAAAESLARARSLTEALLSESPGDETLADFLADLLLSDNAGWTVLEPIEMRSEGGATLTRQADGSILAGGPNTNADVYTIHAAVGTREVRAIRLEALPDPSLPRQGPGRFEMGDFGLREFRVFALSGGDEPADPLPVADAWASYERVVSGNGVHWTIVEGDPRVWYVEGRTGEPHAAVFQLATPLLRQPGQTLMVQCAHHAHVNHPVNLGRFRLSVTDDPAAVEAERKRWKASEIDDPRARLYAAYTAVGDSVRAVEWLAQVLNRIPEFAARRGLVEQVDQTNLADLVAIRPDDPLLWSALAKRQAAAGQAESATESLARARSLTEALLADTGQWTVLEPIEMNGEAGERFTVESDGSIFVSGPNPERAVYTLTMPLDDRPISAIRLETLPDTRLPHGGAGRYPGNGNFHLAIFAAALASGDDGDSNPIPIVSAIDDNHFGPGFSASAALDGNPNTRWDINQSIQQPHWAVFTFSSPVQSTGGRLIVTLDSGITSWGLHGLGRFRLSVTDDPHVVEFPADETLAGFLADLLLTDTTGWSDSGDVLIADFEQETYGAWTVEGEAFGPGPAPGTLPNQMRISGFEGQRLVNSYYHGDGPTGTLTSPPFRIDHHYLAFLIGGGGFEERTCVNLLIDGEVVRTAVGPNTRPGGSEALALCCWDVTELDGQLARIQIVDNASGGWGHVNVDQIVLTDNAEALKQRWTVLELDDPWARLCAAFHLTGDEAALDALLIRKPQAAAGIAAMYANAADFSQAIAWLDRTIEAVPGSAQELARMLRLRGSFYVRAGDWNRAAADYAESVELDPATDSIAWGLPAALWAYAGDAEQHRVQCRKMAERFRTSAQAPDAERTLKVMLLMERGLDPEHAPVEPVLAELSSDKLAPAYRIFFLSARALLACRSGEFAEAQRAVDESLQLAEASGESRGSIRILFGLAVQALIQARQGNVTVAQAAVADLKTLLASRGLAWREDGTLDGSTIVNGERIEHDLLIPEILRREAERLVQDGAAARE